MRGAQIQPTPWRLTNKLFPRAVQSRELVECLEEIDEFHSKLYGKTCTSNWKDHFECDEWFMGQSSQIRNHTFVVRSVALCMHSNCVKLHHCSVPTHCITKSVFWVRWNTVVELCCLSEIDMIRYAWIRIAGAIWCAPTSLPILFRFWWQKPISVLFDTQNKWQMCTEAAMEFCSRQ